MGVVVLVEKFRVFFFLDMIVGVRITLIINLRVLRKIVNWGVLLFLKSLEFW